MLRFSRLPLYPLVLVRERRASGERPRELEPMLMEDQQWVTDYDAAGETVLYPIHHLSALGISKLLPESGLVLDLGCGSGRLLMHLAEGRPDARIIGLDLSEPMLERAQKNIDQHGVGERVELRRCDITSIDGAVAETPDVVTCNFALHHMPDDDHAERCLQGIARIREQTGCAVWISDFARLRDERSFPTIVSMVVPSGPSLAEDGIASEAAAFTFDELINFVEKAGMSDLNHERSSPLGEYQVHSASGRNGDGKPRGVWQETPMPRGSRLFTERTLKSFPRELTRQ